MFRAPKEKNFLKSNFNLNKMLCPRCESRLRLIQTEFSFYLPHCYTCGFEDYSRTTMDPEPHIANSTLSENINPVSEIEGAA